VADRGLTGVLLVGGASRRFGSPKALARFGRETLAERAWRLLGEACDERLAIGKHADHLTLPFELVDDGSDVRAPLAGIVAGLRGASHDVAVVVPVDVPLLLPQDVYALATACADAAIPPRGPLPGAYRKTALPVLERALADGRLALHEVVRELDVRTVAVTPERLANVNEPADLEPKLVPMRAGHADAFRRFVTTSLAEYDFAPEPDLDPDLADPHNAYVAAWIVELAGEVAGSVVLIERSPDEAYLRRMYLTPGLRGFGLGRRLLDVALTWARDHGYRSVFLDTTDAMEAARALYEAAGFREIGTGKPRSGRRRIHYRLELD
jgi:molybdopterin-guanine dinucleotide biosynthesis protein A/N-acetylglutamate synthase-like GNAT family acetyltransferase